MAGHLAAQLKASGGKLAVWNRTASKVEPLRQAGAEVAESLEALGEKCDIVFTCLSRTEDVKACLAELTKKSKRGTLFVDHSTILPKGAKEIAGELGAKGQRFIDAPITGGSMGAQKGQLTIFCGGDAAAIDEARPFMDAYAKRVERVGGSGAGQLTKVANQIAVGASLLALCEALGFAEKAGLDPALTRDLLAGGAAGSWSMDNYGPKLLNRDWSPGFKVKDQLKDFKYCIETAKELDVSIPGTVLLDRLLTETEREGHGEQTTAVLFETLMAMGFED